MISFCFIRIRTLRCGFVRTLPLGQPSETNTDVVETFC